MLLSKDLLLGAILDVFSKDPILEESNLRTMDKVFITPHIASSTSHEGNMKQISNVAIHYSL